MAKLEIVPEYALSRKVVRQIARLRESCPLRPPKNVTLFEEGMVFRALLHHSELLKAQAKFNCRTLMLNQRSIRVFGLHELCLENNDADVSMAQLMEGIELLGKEQAVDFVLYFSERAGWLSNHGFEPTSNDLRQLLPATTHSQLRPQKLLVKPLGFKHWEAGLLDLPTDIA